MLGIFFLSLFVLTLGKEQWESWLHKFGHDTYKYPQWIVDQMDCKCSSLTLRCYSSYKASEDEGITFCEAKEWLVKHMPSFDLQFLPPSVSVNGESMLDDNIAFSLMAFRSVPWKIPKNIQLAYILPYATFHEARVNWRPLFFSKFFKTITKAKNTIQAIQMLASPTWGPERPNTYLNWSSNVWPDYPLNIKNKNINYYLNWASSSTPPVLSPFDFSAYGYASCTGTATILTYIARAVGIPARVVGTPCWNSDDYSGLARDNPNVSTCWQGGNKTHVGGRFLHNHNWVEYWDSEAGRWVFIDVPAINLVPNEGLCDGEFTEETGCGYKKPFGCSQATRVGRASLDHPIFSFTWSFQGENGGEEIVDARELRLTTGESVSPLVWSPKLRSPFGTPMKTVGLRMVNRSDFYRCKEPRRY